MKRQRLGFTLIELLIVMGVIGIISTIAIPALMSAVQRGKQKRSMADLRSIGAAVESYAIDLDSVPGPGAVDVTDIVPSIEPTYLKSVPEHDAWANSFLYTCISAEGEYTLTSLGRDGTASGPGSGPTTSFEDDIIFSSGSFISWPEGTQQ